MQLANNLVIRPHFFFIQRAVPISATKTRMEYDVYRKNDASDDDFKAIDAYFKTVMQEDKILCNGAQRNLNSGVFTSGQLHPQKEKVCSFIIYYKVIGDSRLMTIGRAQFGFKTRCATFLSATGRRKKRRMVASPFGLPPGGLQGRAN